MMYTVLDDDEIQRAILEARKERAKALSSLFRSLFSFRKSTPVAKTTQVKFG